jgi:hypothetical protein
MARWAVGHLLAGPVAVCLLVLVAAAQGTAGRVIVDDYNGVLNSVLPEFADGQPGAGRSLLQTGGSSSTSTSSSTRDRQPWSSAAENVFEWYLNASGVVAAKMPAAAAAADLLQANAWCASG